MIRDKNLLPVQAKIDANQRLDAQDGLTLFKSKDLIGVGRLADHVRRARHGDRAFFVYNQHLNYTNVCLNRCRFCAFARDDGQEGSFTFDLEQARARLMERIDEPITEVHIVGGLNPALGADYYFDLIRLVKEIRPAATVKAFSAVEIDHLARISGLGLGGTLAELKKAGLEMMPGGGAEILTSRVREKLFPKKIGSERWLDVTRAAHEAGIITNATMLYGHIESYEERVEHLIRLRELQDETNGFSAFIPLAFHSANTKLDHIEPTTGFDDLKTMAVSRLMLDNFDHVKAYWVMLSEKLAQVALSFGADDLDGTIIEEKITHMAGATSAKGLTRGQMQRMIEAAGFVPIERDAFYGPVAVREAA